MTISQRVPTSRAWRIVRWALLGTAIAVIALVVWSAVEIFRGPQLIEHALPKDVPFILPSDATDICGLTHPAFWPNLVFEFSIPENSFVEWAKSRGYELKEIDKPYHVYRYGFFAGKDSSNAEATISEGLYYEKTEPQDADRGVQVAYDRHHKRAYYFAHSR